MADATSGAALSLRGLTKTYAGTTPVVRGVDLDVAPGEFMVLVGASGCGKSTTLRMIAGLEDVTSGEVLIGGRDVTDLPPAERGVAMVFQSYALYPHMTVAQNMGFALRVAGLPKAEIAAAVQRASAVLQLDPLLQRKPRELSGGQRQRVAIGRAIVRQPKVFLFDEPLSNLDAALRNQMRFELSRLHRQLGATIVYVTHDQVEAMTLGERIAIFNAGRIEQVGVPMALYARPATRFVAGFLGMPQMNFLKVRMVPGQSTGWDLQYADGSRRRLSGKVVARLGVDPSDVVEMGVRPEHWRLDGQGGRAAKVELLELLGDSTIAHLRLEGSGELVTCKTNDASGAGYLLDSVVDVAPDFDRVLWFDAAGRALGLGA